MRKRKPSGGLDEQIVVGPESDAKRRIIRGGMTTDEIMEMSRGESAVFRRKKK